jgi:hypothetical protein
MTFGSRPSRFPKTAALLLIVAAVLPLAGCGASDKTPVEGTVTIDGEPLAEGRIGFYPKEGRPAYGEIVDGRYTLTTLEPGDGALIGRHRVTVQADKPADPNDAFSDRIPLIPEKYFNPDSSGLTAEVTADGDNTFNFDLTR